MSGNVNVENVPKTNQNVPVQLHLVYVMVTVLVTTVSPQMRVMMILLLLGVAAVRNYADLRFDYCSKKNVFIFDLI